MEGPTDRFGVRERHPTVYQVELPPWLPRNVLEKMVNRFEKILGEQIFFMMLSGAKCRHARRSSEMNTSALSTGSQRVHNFRRDVRNNIFDIDSIDSTVAIEDDSASAANSEASEPASPITPADSPSTPS